MAVSETIVRDILSCTIFSCAKTANTSRPSARMMRSIFTHNPNGPTDGGEVPFVLENARDLETLTRAVVVVKAWHTEVFTQARAGACAGDVSLCGAGNVCPRDQCRRSMPLTKILIPALPTSGEARQQSIDLLHSKGIDAVIPFRTMLSDLIEHIEVNRNYQKSDLLQVRILKNYDLFAPPQLELFDLPKPKRKAKV